MMSDAMVTVELLLLGTSMALVIMYGFTGAPTALLIAYVAIALAHLLALLELKQLRKATR